MSSRRKPTGSSSRAEHPSTRELSERELLVDTHVGGKAEHAFTDHVALHLLGAAADAAAPLTEEHVLPVAAVHGVVALYIAKCERFPFVKIDRLVDDTIDTMIRGLRRE